MTGYKIRPTDRGSTDERRLIAIESALNGVNRSISVFSTNLENTWIAIFHESFKVTVVFKVLSYGKIMLHQFLL